MVDNTLGMFKALDATVTSSPAVKQFTAMLGDLISEHVTPKAMSEQGIVLAMAQAIVNNGKAVIKTIDMADNTEHIFEVSYKEHPDWPFHMLRDGLHWNRVRDLPYIVNTLRQDDYSIVEVS